MTEFSHRFSLTAKSDFETVLDGLLFTAEFKRHSPGTVTLNWLVSGFDASNKLRALLVTRIGCSAMNEREAGDKAMEMVPALAQLASIAKDSAGLLHATKGIDDPNDLENLVAAHLTHHLGSSLAGNPNETAASRVAVQSAFCKSVGLTKFIEFLARFEDVPVTTIRRRIDNARSLGLIPKRGGPDV